MGNFVREAVNSAMPLSPPSPADWLMALGPGQVVILDDSGTQVTLNLNLGDIIPGPIHKIVSTTIAQGVRYGTGARPTAAPTSALATIAAFALVPVACVSVANQATLSGLAQTIDGLALNTAGMRVLLANQTTVSQNGIWVVQAGAWTRPSDWASGAAVPVGMQVEVAPGGTSNFTTYGGTWFVQSVTGGGVIDTGNVVLYPKIFKKTITLVAGTYTVGNGGGGEALWLLSGASIQVSENTPAGTLGTERLDAPSASRTTGVAGTASFVINSLIDAGTVAGSDTSTVDVLVTNA